MPSWVYTPNLKLCELIRNSSPSQEAVRLCITGFLFLEEEDEGGNLEIRTSL